MSNTHEWARYNNNNNAFTSYSNNFWYNDGIGMPTGNLALNGHYPIKVYSCGPDYATGATYAAINYQSIVTSGPYLFPDSGGTFRFMVGHGSGTMYVGRNTAAGGTLRDSAYGPTALTGTMAGTLQWATVPTQPASINAVRNGRSVTVTHTAPSSDGGAVVSSRAIQYSTDGGVTWSAPVTSAGSTVFAALPANLTYKFRVYANNEVGSSAARVSADVFIPAGGNRFDGAVEQSAGTAVRWDGTSEVAMTGYRWNGTSEVPLS